MNCKEYHDTIWLPFSNKLDIICSNNFILRKIKKAFDVHFSILGLLNILATPKDDLDCYIYAIKRSKPHKYSHLKWEQRIRLIKALLKEIRRA